MAPHTAASPAAPPRFYPTEKARLEFSILSTLLHSLSSLQVTRPVKQRLLRGPGDLPAVQNALPCREKHFLLSMASTETGASAPPPEAVAAPVEGMASLTVEGQPPAGEAQPTSAEAEDKANEEVTPPHRSHDPATNLKRTDPFQFGSRYLTEEDNVFEFNAWDHVETDDAYKEYAEQQFEKQRQSPVSDFDKSEFTPSLPTSIMAFLAGPVI